MKKARKPSKKSAQRSSKQAGDSATRRALRKKNGRRIPAIALTGFVRIDDKSKAIAAGYQTHISKPVDLGNLTSKIVRLVQKNRT